MINYILKASNFKNNSSYGKFFAKAVSKELIDIDDLSKLMRARNLPYSTGVIKGLLVDMVCCIKEQLLAGNSVKIDDLAVFGISIRNVEGGAESEKDFNIAKHIEGVSLTCRPVGELRSQNVKAEIEFNKIEACDCDKADDTTEQEPEQPGNNGTDNGNTGGGTTGGDLEG